MKVPSVMTHSFSQVPRAEIPRSSFDRSFGHKTTFDAGYLIPVFLDEALPGDTFNVQANIVARMGTPLFPIMDNLFMDIFFFAVPYRLVWNNWQKFNGEQANPADSTDYVLPTMTSTAVTGYLENSLHDYMGLPTAVPGLPHMSLFHRSYNLIWNEWFRDQNLQNSVAVDKDDGPDSPTDYVLLRRGKRHDYFTSCLPWPQKGTSVEIPIGTSAPVVSTGDGQPVFEVNGVTSMQLQGQSGVSFAYWSSAATGNDVASWYNTKLEADLTSATAATINQLRQAFQVQRLYERDARGGSRYTEIVRSHFGVVSDDARLQRPEFLSHASRPVVINPVANTAGNYVGDLSAYATCQMTDEGFTKSFTEHCLILGLVSVRADITYQQGLNRMFSRSTRWDHYWPSLSMVGEQAVLNKEIFAVGTGGATDDNVFGYQERYAEYRYKPSYVTGAMRSNAAAPLDAWHLALDFASLPVLNAAFIQDDAPLDRVVAVPTEPHFVFDSYFKMKCARPMPVYGVPGMIDHF